MWKPSAQSISKIHACKIHPTGLHRLAYYFTTATQHSNFGPALIVALASKYIIIIIK